MLAFELAKYGGISNQEASGPKLILLNCSFLALK